jgi:hypothetical protein
MLTYEKYIWLFLFVGCHLTKIYKLVCSSFFSATKYISHVSVFALLQLNDSQDKFARNRNGPYRNLRHIFVAGEITTSKRFLLCIHEYFNNTDNCTLFYTDLVLYHLHCIYFVHYCTILYYGYEIRNIFRTNCVDFGSILVVEDF